MTASIRDSDSAFNDSGSNITTLDVSLAGIVAGDTVAVWVGHEGAPTTISVATSGGSDSFTGEAKEDHANGDMSGQWFYLLAATVTGTVTYRVTFGAGKPYPRMLAYAVNPDGKVASLAAHNVGSGTSTTPTSGAISPTGDDLIVLGGFKEYTGSAPSSLTINGVASDGSISASYSRAWYRLLTAGFTSGTAAGSGYSNAAWICNVLALSFTAAAAPDFPFLLRTIQRRF